MFLNHVHSFCLPVFNFQDVPIGNMESFFLTFSCEIFHKLIHFINFLLPVIFTQEHIVETSFGSVSVVVYGDQDKPALITYPDIALNREYWYLLLFF